MITHLDLNNFKCFERLRLPLAPLTLLSGANASGKSSVLQALALLHQTIREHEWSTRLMLNGGTIRLGTIADIVDKIHGRRSFQLGLADEDSAYEWTFSGERTEMSMQVSSVRAGKLKVDSPELLRFLFLHSLGSSPPALAERLRCMTYITAERVGPREVYPLEDRQVASVVGPVGEHAVSVLFWGMDEPVLVTLAIPDTPNTRLRQVQERMKDFFPGCSLDVQQVPQANALTLGLRTSDATDFHRPIHVGFGLTQVLPIVIAALSASVGDILLIENPEVHLHPAGQSQMGLFLADVARSGVQVIVETHSDHVLNGIRRAVKTRKLPCEQVALHYFQARAEDNAQVISPIINEDGDIDTWPEGFFDQFDRDANYFAGWGK